MKSDAEKLTRDEELLKSRKKAATQVKYGELFGVIGRMDRLEERVDLLAKAVKLIMQRPVQHAISAEEAETLKEVIASL